MNIEVFSYLKDSCKRQGMTYKDLANALDLSEVSIKRIFCAKKCSLDQFHALCRGLHLHPAQVYAETSKIQDVFMVSKKLEEYFLENYPVFLFYRQLCFSKSPDSIRKKNNLTVKDTKAYLSELRRLNLIRIGQKGKIEFLNSKVMELPKNGELMKRVRKEWVPYFVEQTQEKAQNHNHLFETFTVSLNSASAELLKLRLIELKEELFKQAEKDKRGLKEDKGLSVLWAMGPYRMAIDGEIPPF